MTQQHLTYYCTAQQLKLTKGNCLSVCIYNYFQTVIICNYN